MRVPITIFDNYDVEDWFECARQGLIDNDIENPTDDQIWNEASEIMRFEWEECYEEMKRFFDSLDEELYIGGTTERWNGKANGFNVFTSFEQLFLWATKDCDYWKIWDDKGHLYLECSHHDGTNEFEIKLLTKKGSDYLYNYEHSWDDKRSPRQIHEQVRKRYTRLPRYWDHGYGM